MEHKQANSRVAKCQVNPLRFRGVMCHTFTTLKNHTFICLLMVATLSLSACRNSTEKPHAGVEEAMSAYKDFFREVKDKRKADMDEIIALTKEWRELDAAVTAGLERDSTDGYNAHANGKQIALADSVSSQMVRLVNSGERSFTDYLLAVRNLNDVVMDTASQKLADSVHRFYRNVSAISTYKGSGKEVVRRYDKLLKDALTGGIHTKQQAIDFLRNEDVAFRSFLRHLPTLSTGDIPLDGITVNTGKAVMRIIALADTAHHVFDKSEVVILLTMRNNRRLLQNAEACVEDIGRIRRMDGGQASAYLWMLLQPWITFDGFAYALMDEDQMRTMEKLAAATPKALEKLAGADFPLDTKALPNMLIETFILEY